MKLDRLDELVERTDDGRRRWVQKRVVEEREIAPVLIRTRQWRALTVLVGLVGGSALVALGSIAIARGDVDGTWNEPIVDVNGWPHSPLLGLLEVIAGGTLILVSTSATSEMIAGVVIAGFGVIAVAEPTVLDDGLSIESAHAWALVAIGGAAVLAGVLSTGVCRWSAAPRYYTATHARDEEDLDEGGL